MGSTGERLRAVLGGGPDAPVDPTPPEVEDPDFSAGGIALTFTTNGKGVPQPVDFGVGRTVPLLSAWIVGSGTASLSLRGGKGVPLSTTPVYLKGKNLAKAGIAVTDDGTAATVAFLG